MQRALATQCTLLVHFTEDWNLGPESMSELLPATVCPGREAGTLSLQKALNFSGYTGYFYIIRKLPAFSQDMADCFEIGHMLNQKFYWIYMWRHRISARLDQMTHWIFLIFLWVSSITLFPSACKITMGNRNANTRLICAFMWGCMCLLTPVIFSS